MGDIVINNSRSSVGLERAETDAIIGGAVSIYGGRSSVGRAQGCGPWGRGFEPRRSPVFK